MTITESPIPTIIGIEYGSNNPHYSAGLPCDIQHGIEMQDT